MLSTNTNVPFLSFHWVQVNTARVLKRPCWFVTRGIWSVETNLERASGEQRRGEQSCAKEVGKGGFEEPKGHCGVLPWIDSSCFWLQKTQNENNAWLLVWKIVWTLLLCVTYELQSYPGCESSVLLIKKIPKKPFPTICWYIFAVLNKEIRSMCTYSSLWAVSQPSQKYGLLF